MPHQITDLGDLERDVLRLVWKHGPASAEAVQRLIGRPLRESTIRTVLKRLELKGHLKHATQGRTYLYSATEGRAAAAARAVKGIVDLFCNGSMEDVLLGMVAAETLDRRELKRLADKITKAKGGQSS